MIEMLNFFVQVGILIALIRIGDYLYPRRGR